MIAVFLFQLYEKDVVSGQLLVWLIPEPCVSSGAFKSLYGFPIHLHLYPGNFAAAVGVDFDWRTFLGAEDFSHPMISAGDLHHYLRGGSKRSSRLHRAENRFPCRLV